MFFSTNLNLNLEELKDYLYKEYLNIENEIITDNSFEIHANFSYTQSASTINWTRYNLFQFYNEQVYDLYRAVQDLMLLACENYKIDYYKNRYMAQAWFNITKSDSEQLRWHDHWHNNLDGVFHGYFCVNAEPSITEYQVGDSIVEIENKNNVAILSETGRKHRVGKWNSSEDRITIAYDCIPLKKVIENKWKRQQHYVYL